MNPWIILGFVLAVSASAGAGYLKGDAAGEARVQQRWDHEKADQLAVWVEQQDQARKKEQALQANAENLRREKDREIRDLNARATALSNSVQQRAARPTESGGLSATPGAGQSATGCTGAGLSREDAQFLAGEAARADQLRASLKQCYAQYEAVSK